MISHKQASKSKLHKNKENPPKGDVKSTLAKESRLEKFTSRMLSDLLRELPVAVVLYQDDGMIYDCNNLACRMFGYSREEMQKLRQTELLPKIFLRIVPDPFIQENITNGEFIWVSRRRKDGTIFQCEQSSKLIVSGGKEFCLTCYRQFETLGVSEQKSFMSKELSTALTVNTPFCVQTWQEINGELRLIGFNPTLEGYTEGKIKDYTGCTVHDLYATRGRNDVVDLIYETYRKKGMLRIETFCDFLIPGNERFVDTVSFFVTPNILVQYIEDVTEQRKALAALKESEERFRALFLGSPVPVMTWRYTNGEFILDEYNLAMNKFTSGKISDLLGAGAKQLFSANPEICEDIQICFNEHKIVQRQTMVVFSGDERHLSITHAYVPNNLVLTHIHDITDQKRAEDELLRYQQELSNLYEKHLNVLEHERQRISQELHDGIGQYLSTIKVSTENLLLSNVEKMDRQSMEEQLRANIALLKEAIMDVSKVSMDLRPSILDDLGLIATINWFLREFGKVYKNIMIEKNVSLEDSEIPQNIKIVIFRVLQEAMNNIVKHSNADHVQIFMHKTVDALEFIIKDNGMGFDVPKMQKNRCGLGIASMRERVAFSQGRFSIESDEGRGTIVKFVWPLNG